MLRNIVVFTFVVLYGTSISAQLDGYKYIVVPKKFLTFKEYNQYQSSTIIKHFMQQAGFNVLYEDELPQDGAANRCLALFADVQDNSSMLKTKVAIALNDCKGNSVYLTPEAQTKEKDLLKAYKEVITEASSYFTGLTHNYRPPTAPKKINTQVTEQSKAPSPISASPTDGNIVPTEAKEGLSANNGTSLNAIGTNDGYLLVDGADTIQYRLTKTAAENVFHADKKGVKGIVYQKEGKWYFESEKEQDKMVEELVIVF
ncbi:Hypothetical protein I595_907 [Croceitalea dokdonensis DOKDO 023]|uniref:Secreted protein n=1 Tax=Croceitalea dokdonensis DOKDO 023 TaxID=1300341 RepID=A0A0P7AGB1_9FLAO|nr:hypothetical protein [Croceitalea dokdonensis]KPM32489.1 Hypothetical protein I595_907 [Croceitalea dokdonensis DOKDO 023]